MIFQVIIPARAKSKRLPGKNIKLLGDKPLIEYSIDYALSNFSKTSVWVNSDDYKVIKIAKKKEIQTLFRPSHLALDDTPTVEVLKYHLDYFLEHKIKCDAIIILQPTNPFRDVMLLKNAVRIFRETKRNSLATFSKFQKKIGKVENELFKPFNYLPGQRSQDLDMLYFENGQLYIVNSISIKKDEIITDDVYPIIQDSIESTIDIDYLDDFLLAEAFLKMKMNKYE